MREKKKLTCLPSPVLITLLYEMEKVPFIDWTDVRINPPFCSDIL